ncbi:MAG TPA: hypothetical protein DCF44_01535 [Chitinophagaceae bacterium]|nr:hypothetical protein [Chitinophagaceae bacterium]
MVAYNSTFAIGGMTFFHDTIVVNGSAVLRINICDENPAHRKSAKQYDSFLPLLVSNCKIWVYI